MQTKHPLMLSIVRCPSLSSKIILDEMKNAHLQRIKMLHHTPKPHAKTWTLERRDNMQQKCNWSYKTCFEGGGQKKLGEATLMA